MKNIAKCLNCDDMIESFHSTDYMECSCKSIYVDGGESLKCGATDWGLFARINEAGDIIPVEYRESIVDEIKPIMNDLPQHGPSVENLIDNLHHMATEMDRLPDQALRQYVSQYDLYRVVSLLSAIFKSI